MTTKQIRRIGIGVGLGLVVLGVALAANWQILPLPKTVTLVVDGQSHTMQVTAWNIRHLLQLSQVRLTPYDEVIPPPDTRLQDGMTITIQRARAVVIQSGIRKEIIYTPSSQVADWLDAAGVNIQPGDSLLADGQEIGLTQQSGAQYLQVVQPVNITVLVDGESQQVKTNAATVGQALWLAGIRVRQADSTEPLLSAPLKEAMRVNIQQAQPVQIQTKTGTYSILSAAATVGEALADNGFALQGLDYSKPAEGQPLPADGKIQIVRVQEVVLSTQTTIPFQVTYQADPNTEIDSQSVITPGVAGLEEQRQRVRYEDGIEVNRTDEGVFMISAPQNQVSGYGTKLVMHTIDTPDGPINYWRAVTMWATSYHPAALRGSTTTASGLTLHKGLVAVDRRYVPFYTRLYIPGYGEAIAADTGGGVIGRMIDLGYDDSDYVSWHQNVVVYFLWPPPANIVWIFP